MLNERETEDFFKCLGITTGHQLVIDGRNQISVSCTVCEQYLFSLLDTPQNVVKQLTECPQRPWHELSALQRAMLADEQESTIGEYAISMLDEAS